MTWWLLAWALLPGLCWIAAVECWTWWHGETRGAERLETIPETEERVG